MTTDEPALPASDPWASPAPETAGVAPPPVAPGPYGPPPGAGGPPAAYGAPVAPHAYPRTGYPGAPPPARGKTGMIALIVGLSLLAICVLGGAAIAAIIAFQPSDETVTAGAGQAPSAAPSPTPQRPLEVSDCVSGATREYVLQTCPHGTDRVLALVEDDKNCPAETDSIGADSDDQRLCLVSNAAPHAGAPGGGGGIIRVGDCLPDIDVDGVVEVPCVAGKAFHRITAIVKAAKSCAAPAVRWLDANGALGSPAGEIVCAIDARGIAGPGECVAWGSTTTPVTYLPVPCTNRPVLRFTGRSKTIRGCGRYGGTSWYYIDPYNALPYVKYNCYRKLG